ncbi:MAG TPA: DUF6600 domain-containing protein [Vicinamibacterales bacterium]|jgi:hypothetical protein
MSCKGSNQRDLSRTRETAAGWVRCFAAAVFVVAVPAASAWADPPARVARISYASGSVSFRPASIDDWTTASLNYPLTVGDHLWTDRGARSELEIGSAVVRVAPGTELSILNLDDRTAQFRVTQGALSIRVRGLSEGDVVEFDTPNSAVSVLQPGLYRVDVDDSGNASVATTRRGELDASAAGSRMTIAAGQAVTLTGPDGTPSSPAAAAATDPFEDWSLTRDRATENIQSAQYVSRDTIGYQDLDQNGSWEVTAAYGPVWYPHVAAQWAPYRYGRWVWVDPWGWTWVDQAPWGFAPFHYGRWVYVSTRWAWVPGTIVARPVYAPALVAFVGGPAWSASFTVGAAPVAWFPLGPHEVFVPVYHVTPVYVQRVNAAHVTNVNVTTVNVTNVTYVNRAVPGAVTVVSHETFVNARPVATSAVVVTREQLRSATVVSTTAAVVPERVSVVGGARASVAVPPAAAVSRQVVVRAAPPPPPASFAVQRPLLEQHPGQPLDTSASAALTAQSSAARAHPLVRAAAVSAPAAPAPRALPSPPPLAAAPPKPAAPNPNPAPAKADLAARHAQERADMNARHEKERADLQARHEQERHATTDAHQREALKQRQQQEVQAMQERHRQEREAVQKRQQQERKPT